MTYKNKITLYTGCGEEKKKVELYDFTKVDYYDYQLRVLCGNRYYYFRPSITAISKIEIYEEKENDKNRKS